MRKSYLYSAGILLTVLIGFYRCTKSNGIDNNQIIETPYSLFFADSNGAVYKTNDGKTYTSVFQADGLPCRAICTRGNNILLVKNYLYVSNNNGQSFSIGNKDVSNDTSRDCHNSVIGLNQSMLIDLPDWNRAYVACNNHLSSLGQEYSPSGIFGSWIDTDDIYDTVGGTSGGGIGTLPVNMVSYTRLANGVLAGLAVQSSSIYRNFYKTSMSATSYWMECTGGSHGAHRDLLGTPLPSGGFYTLGHLNNRLIAIDGSCNYGAYYSDDTGRTWVHYTGIPSGTSLLSICSPFEETCIIGSNSGLYMLNLNTSTFAVNNSGLTSDIVVRGIAYKQNLYKTGTTQKYVYLATNKGIFQSSDGGNNWILTIAGNYTAIY